MPAAALPAIIGGVLGVGSMIDQNVQSKAAIKNNQNAQDQAAAQTQKAYGNSLSGLNASYNPNANTTNITSAPTIAPPTGSVNARSILGSVAQNPSAAYQQFTQLPPAAQQQLIAQVQASQTGPNTVA